MLRHRFKLFLSVVALLGSTQALAQEPTPAGMGPFRPSNIRYDLELFAPPDLSTYGNWPRPNEGFFFQYDRLYWAIQQPSRTEIGVPGGRSAGLLNGTDVFNPINQPASVLLTEYSNSLDTGMLRATQTWGNRWEFGYMEEDKGWFISILHVGDQDQTFDYGASFEDDDGTPAGIFMVFNDPQDLLLGFVDTNGDGFDDDLNFSGAVTPFNRVPGVFGRPGDPPLNLDTDNDGVPDAYAGFTDFGDRVPLVPLFNQLQVRNVTSISGVEISRTWRYAPTHRGSIWEAFFGVRWLLYQDAFSVDALNDQEEIFPFEPVGLAGLTFWDSNVSNNLFGPQIGFRYRQSAGRFSVNAEGRFLAAVNFQSVHLNGTLASALDPTPNETNIDGAQQPIFTPNELVRTSFDNWQYDETFAPVGEFRANVNYQLTKAVSVQAGYNFLLGSGISRASRRINYTLPALEILDDNKNDAWFVNGLNFGVTVNR